MPTHEVKFLTHTHPAPLTLHVNMLTQDQMLHTYTLFSPKRALATYVLLVSTVPVGGPAMISRLEP